MGGDDEESGYTDESNEETHRDIREGENGRTRTSGGGYLYRVLGAISMETVLDGIRQMLLGIQLTLLGYVFQDLRLAPEEVNGLLLLVGTVLTIGGFVAGRG